MKLSAGKLKQGFIQGYVYSTKNGSKATLGLVYYAYCNRYNVQYTDMCNYIFINRDFESCKEAQKFYDDVVNKYNLKLN